jgi:hypothetical protein
LKAIDCLRQALDAERTRRTVLTQAGTELAWLIATEALATHYDEALQALLGADEAFPISRFKVHGARAMILAAKGAMEASRAEVIEALQAAAAGESGFRYHQAVGLVRGQHAEQQALLRKLAAAEPRGAADEGH